MTGRPNAFRVGQSLCVAVGVAGTAGVFLPFTFSVSPWDAMTDPEVRLLAYPFFLAILISALSIRWMMRGPLSLPERVGAYVMSVSSVLATLSLYVFGDSLSPANSRETIALILPFVILLPAAYLVLKAFRSAGATGEFAPILAMQAPYVANAVLCLIAFWGDWQSGAFAALAASVAFAVQSILVATHRTVLLS